MRRRQAVRRKSSHLVPNRCGEQRYRTRTDGSDGTRHCPNGDSCVVNSDCTDRCTQINADSCSNQCKNNAACGNGRADTGETCATCAADIQCQSGTQCCSDGTCKASCGGGMCGNGSIETGETCISCPSDVTCQSGTQCCSDGTCRSSCTAIACNNNNVCDTNETCTCDDCAG